MGLTHTERWSFCCGFCWEKKAKTNLRNYALKRNVKVFSNIIRPWKYLWKADVIILLAMSGPHTKAKWCQSNKPPKRNLTRFATNLRQGTASFASNFWFEDHDHDYQSQSASSAAPASILLLAHHPPTPATFIFNKDRALTFPSMWTTSRVLNLHLKYHFPSYNYFNE